MNALLVVALVFIVGINVSYSRKALFKLESKQVIEHGRVKHYAYASESSTWTAAAYYEESYNYTGWDIFQTETNPNVSDEKQAYGAGFLEGYMTWEAIYKHYYNNFNNFCVGMEAICKKIDDFLDQNTLWIKGMIKENGKRSSPWHHIKLVYKQIQGIYVGYNQHCDSDKKLSYNDILKVNFQEDVSDLVQVFNNSASLNRETHCSAIIKLLPNYSDILIGHNAWNGYTSMVRMLKRYKHHYRTSSHSTMKVFGISMAFSSYPGVASSIDDYYLINSNIVTLETTINNYNKSLWNRINPQVVFEPVRVMIANRLANNGRSWGEYFSPYNSGTYNNQWMIVDLNKFTKGSKPLLGLLYIIEQMPGYIRMEDQTLLFLNQTYWASYNIPFYTDIFNMTGNQEMLDKYGDWFSHEKSPRAQIFRRDHGNVTDIESLLTLLRSNDYKHDPLSVCKVCVPPYNANYAIAARSDLNPVNGTYPPYGQGSAAYGAIDAKVMSSSWALTTEFTAVCGPTTASGLPAFKWSTSHFNDTLHIGQPDVFNFNPVHVTWT